MKKLNKDDYAWIVILSFILIIIMAVVCTDDCYKSVLNPCTLEEISEFKSDLKTEISVDVIWAKTFENACGVGDRSITIFEVVDVSAAYYIYQKAKPKDRPIVGKKQRLPMTAEKFFFGDYEIIAQVK